MIGVLRRVVVRGTEEALEARLVCTQGSESAVINTAYIERLQATLRSHPAPLARKTRSAVRLRVTLEAGMWLSGTAYNFCSTHRSLRVAGGGTEQRWIERTPAQAVGLADHCWSFYELLSFAVPPSELPKRRGRRPKWLLEAAHVA